MSKPNTGGAAFPHIVFDEGRSGHGLHSTSQENPGMTIRQYYKANALPAIIDKAFRGTDPEKVEGWNVMVSNLAGIIADALIAEDEEFEKRGSE